MDPIQIIILLILMFTFGYSIGSYKRQKVNQEIESAYDLAAADYLHKLDLKQNEFNEFIEKQEQIFLAKIRELESLNDDDYIN